MTPRMLDGVGEVSAGKGRRRPRAVRLRAVAALVAPFEGDRRMAWRYTCCAWSSSF